MSLAASDDDARSGVWTVDTLTDEIKRLLESGFRSIWVEGEVTDCRAASSGHLYFTLRGNHAHLSSVAFRSVARTMPRPLRDGERVTCAGDIEVYPPSGRYQLVVRQVRFSGEGDLLAALEALKRKLHAEGLFDPARKRPLPFLPRRVGVVTSHTGAAVRDIVRSIHSRFPVPIVLGPARVQGDGAAGSIARAMAAVAALDDVDVVVIGRGGGSLRDLWAFNEESLARAVAACPKPVVSAVGHEIDTVLTDLVADARAPTPTAAGSMVVPVHAELVERIDRLVAGATRGLRRTVALASTRLQALRSRLGDPLRPVRERWVRLDELDARLRRASVLHRARFATRLSELRGRLSRLHPAAQLARERRVLEERRGRLARAAAARLERDRARLERLQTVLEALGPAGALRRGFAIVRTAEGAVVRSYRDVTPGAHVGILLGEGSLGATVTDRTAGEGR